MASDQLWEGSVRYWDVHSGEAHGTVRLSICKLYHYHCTKSFLNWPDEEDNEESEESLSIFVVRQKAITDRDINLESYFGDETRSVRVLVKIVAEGNGLR